MKNVIVVGADSALGYALLKLLENKGIGVSAVVPVSSVNKNAVPVSPLVKFFEYKPSELVSVSKKLTEDYDALFYLDSVEPIQSAPDAAELAVRSGCAAFIGAGSQAELRPFDDGPYGAVGLAAGKLSLELCRKNGLRFSWLRFSNIYGPYDSEASFFSANLISLVSGATELLLPEDESEFDLINAADAAQALFLAASLPAPKEFYNMVSGNAISARVFAEKMSATVSPGTAVTYNTDSGLRLFKNGPGISGPDLLIATSSRSAVPFEEGLLAALPWAQETWEKNKKRVRLCRRIIDIAIAQYDSGELTDSLKSFFQVLEFKKYLYAETLDALDKLFSEGNKDFYRENFDFNLNYFAEHGITDFEIDFNEKFRLYYTGAIIRLHDLEQHSFLDLAIQDLDDDNLPKHLQVPITYAGIIIDCDEAFSQSMDYAEKHYADTDIYIFAPYRPLLLAYLQLMNFSDTELKILKIFSSAAEMESYFRANPGRYLPKSIISKDSARMQKLFRRLEAVSVARRGITRENSDNIIMTIGIPSFKRSKLLLEKIKFILALKRDIEFELFVSINGWAETRAADPESFDEIERIKDSRFRLSKHENNIVTKNFSYVVENSRGKYCFLISDEDYFNLEKFDYIIQTLSGLKGVSVYKTAGTYQGKGMESAYYKKGAEALLKFNFNNYISGTVYNRDLFARSQAGIKADGFYDRGNSYAFWYLIPVMDMYMCTVGDVFIDSTLGYIDYGPQSYYEQVLFDQGLPMSYARPETRMEQYEDYTGVLFDIAKLVGYEPGIIYSMFINFSARNFFLISCVKNILDNRPEGADPSYIMVLEYTRGKIERFNKDYFRLAGIEENSPEALELTRIFHDIINQVALSYLSEPDKYSSYFNKF